MGACYACSILGICMSIWAIVQLAVMGYSYSIETPMLFEDVEPHEYDDIDDFIAKCEENYKITAKNCYVVAYIYIGVMVLLIFSALKSRLSDKVDALKKLDDELFCDPMPSKKKKTSK